MSETQTSQPSDTLPSIWDGWTHQASGQCIVVDPQNIHHTCATGYMIETGPHAAGSDGGEARLSRLPARLSFRIGMVGCLDSKEGRLGYGASVFYLFTTGLHSSILGALMTFARVPWYPAYAGSAKLSSYPSAARVLE